MEESVWEGEEKRQGWWDADDDDNDDEDEAEGGTRGLTVTTQMHQPH